MIPITVATWYSTSRAPRTLVAADSATNTGTTTTDTPMVRPSRSRATISEGTLQANADSSENRANVPATRTIDRFRPIRFASAPPNSAPNTSPTTTAVVTSCC